MAQTITYEITGTYPPFAAELRENDVEGNVVDNAVHDETGIYSFTDVPVGTYVVVIYDTVGGIKSAGSSVTTTTTTTTTTAAPTTTTTTTTTTAAPTTTTTTTTTAAPTTTTTTTAAPDLANLEFANVSPASGTLASKNETVIFQIQVNSSNFYPINYRLLISGFPSSGLGMDGDAANTFSENNNPRTNDTIPFHTGIIGSPSEVHTFSASVINNIGDPTIPFYSVTVRIEVDEANDGIYVSQGSIFWNVNYF